LNLKRATPVNSAKWESLKAQEEALLKLKNN
jgi:hypothetical protein